MFKTILNPEEDYPEDAPSTQNIHELYATLGFNTDESLYDNLYRITVKYNVIRQRVDIIEKRLNSIDTLIENQSNTILTCTFVAICAIGLSLIR